MTLFVDPVADLAQDYVIFGMFKTPGRCVVRHGASPRKWDKRAGYGTSGATVVFNGNDLAEPEIDVYIWTQTQLEDWKILVTGAGLAKAPVGTKPRAIGVSHPTLNTAPISISMVVIRDVTAWEPDDDGIWKCTIKLLEYRAALPALGKPLPGIPAATAPIPTAQDAADQMIVDLTAENAAAANFAAGSIPGAGRGYSGN